MDSKRNARFDSERDADKNPASENGWGTHGPPARNSFDAGPDKAQVNSSREGSMQHTFFWSVSFFVATWTASAVADSPKLKGEYAFTGTAACLSTAAPGPGFNPNFTPTDGSFGQSFAVEGIRTFNGDGTGTVKGHSMGITIPANMNSAGSDDFSFSFRYTVNDDDTWTSNVMGVETGTIKTGPRAGQTFTVAHSPASTGMISRNGSTLTLATLDPTVEIVTFSNGDVHKRICHRSRVFIKLRNSD
jgi:hypothetical protein